MHFSEYPWELFHLSFSAMWSPRVTASSSLSFGVCILVFLRLLRICYISIFLFTCVVCESGYVPVRVVNAGEGSPSTVAFLKLRSAPAHGGKEMAACCKSVVQSLSLPGIPSSIPEIFLQEKCAEEKRGEKKRREGNSGGTDLLTVIYCFLPPASRDVFGLPKKK
eukprot:RCo008559